MHLLKRMQAVIALSAAAVQAEFAIEPGVVSSTLSSASASSTTPSSSYRACWVSTDLSESSCPGDAGQVQQREQAAGEGDRWQPNEAEGLDQGDEAAGDVHTRQLNTHKEHQNFVTRAWTFFSDF